MANNKDFIVKNGLTVGTDATITNSLFVPNIDTTDSSAITITPSAIFSSDVTVENNLYANNNVVGGRFFGDGSGLYNITALAAVVGRTEEFPTVTDGSPTVTMNSAYAINALDVFLNGVRLRPYTDYSVSGTTLTFNENLGSQDIVALYIFDYATKTEEYPTVTNGSADVTLGDTYSLSQLDVYLNGAKLKPTTDFTLDGTTLTFPNALVTGDVVSVVIYSGAGVGGGSESFASLSDVDVAGQATDTLIKFDGTNYVPSNLSEDGSGNLTVAGQLNVSTIDTTDSSALTITPDVVMSAGLTVGNHIVPSSNENIDLGSASFRFRDLYLTGNITTTGYSQAEGFVGSGGTGTHILAPHGAHYATLSSSITGAIKVTLPQSWTNTMLRFTVKVYEYDSGESFDIVCAGYNYSPLTAWFNTSAYILGDPTVSRNFNVRFGHDGSKCCVYIGETNSTWSYPQVMVSEFYAGYQNYDIDDWNDNWDISFATSLGTITSTRSNNEIGRYVDNNLVWHAGNDGSGSGLDADLLDGLDSLQFLRSDEDDTMNGSLTITGNLVVSGQLETSTIDTSDSSAITITPAVVFSSDVNIENSLRVNKITSTDSSTLEIQIPTQFSSDVTVDQDVTASRYFGDGSNLTGINAGGMPAGTKQIFVQSTAPVGWTKDTTHNDKAMRVVSGTAGSGGSDAFTTTFGSGKTTASHTLTESEIPAHTHATGTDSVLRSEFASGSPGFHTTVLQSGSGTSTGSTGGDGGHSHNLSGFDLQYVDVIIATKD